MTLTKNPMMIEKPLVTVSGKKTLFHSGLRDRVSQDLPQEGIDWRRRLDSNAKSVYIDVDFVDFEVDFVERSSEQLSRSKASSAPSVSSLVKGIKALETTDGQYDKPILALADQESDNGDTIVTSDEIDNTTNLSSHLSEVETAARLARNEQQQQQSDITQAFFSQKLLGRPILHTYWADKTDFEDENQKSQFDAWIGKVQASSCTEWAIIIIEDGDFKAQLGTALFKSKLQSSTSQANVSSSSIASTTQSTNHSFLERMKKGLSTIFLSDSNSDRWLTLVNQDRLPDNRAQESYTNFVKKFRSSIMNSFSKHIELFEEQLRVQRELRTDKNWNFFSYFSMQEELAFAFEFLTLFDEALVQYELLDALFTEYISSAAFNSRDEPQYEKWTSFRSWPGLCLDMSNRYSMELRKRIVDKEASLLDLRNYLFAKQCDLMLMQNEPWRVAASAAIFLTNCVREHHQLNIDIVPGALTCWSFVSALEVLQKCECYSCTSTMENYSLHTVDIWNCARRKLLELGHLSHRMPGMGFDETHAQLVANLLSGLGPDPHGGVSYQNNEISPQARLRDALGDQESFTKHYIEISELTLGTYKHIGRKRHALLVGMELADFYLDQRNFSRAILFLNEMERTLIQERWTILLEGIRRKIAKCTAGIEGQQEQQT